MWHTAGDKTLLGCSVLVPADTAQEKHHRDTARIMQGDDHEASRRARLVVLYQ